jgi:hypothetical protein
VARPTKLTPELQRQICTLLEDGNFVETVCDYVGIDKTTFYDWMMRGGRGWKTDIDDGFVEFSHAVKNAIALAEMQTLGEQKSGGMNWQAKAWWLERRHPDKWGNRGKNTNLNVQVDMSTLPDEIIDKLARGEEVDLATIASASRTGKKAAASR